MNALNMLSCEELLLACTNRKKTTTNDMINWYTFSKIKYMKEHPLKLFFETYEDIDTKYADNLEQQQCLNKILRMDKRSFQWANFGQIGLPVLYPHGRVITSEKMKDLTDLLQCVPQKYHKFYCDLRHDSTPNDPNIVIEESDGDGES